MDAREGQALPDLRGGLATVVQLAKLGLLARLVDLELRADQEQREDRALGDQVVAMEDLDPLDELELLVSIGRSPRRRSSLISNSEQFTLKLIHLLHSVKYRIYGTLRTFWSNGTYRFSRAQR